MDEDKDLNDLLLPLKLAGLKIEGMPEDLRRLCIDSSNLATEGNLLELLKRLRFQLDGAIKILESSSSG